MDQCPPHSHKLWGIDKRAVKLTWHMIHSIIACGPVGPIHKQASDTTFIAPHCSRWERFVHAQHALFWPWSFLAVLAYRTCHESASCSRGRGIRAFLQAPGPARSDAATGPRPDAGGHGAFRFLVEAVSTNRGWPPLHDAHRISAGKGVQNIGRGFGRRRQVAQRRVPDSPPAPTPPALSPCWFQ